MAGKQTLICPDCSSQFDFDPNSDEKVITSLNESFKPTSSGEVEVVAYLECPQGHIRRYKVKKNYN